MSWFAEAPANIALIKYMGKKNSLTNLPDNPSLSYTLNNLITTVTMEPLAGAQDQWEPLTKPDLPTFALSTAAQSRFLNHLARIKQRFNYVGNFMVRSNNNFPHSSGLASSASSFAALTRCAVMALSELTQTPLPSIEEQANLSREGSGSSCRSFFSPWGLWDEESVTNPSLPYTQLHHEVIVISHAVKEVSSSNAHQRIKTSPHYAQRSVRARAHLSALLEAFDQKQWQKAYEICWDEFQDMHQLFSTCDEPFVYQTKQSDAALTLLQDLWQREGDGPLVTMDAGPNIHLLYRLDQMELAKKFKRDYLMGHYHVL